MDMAVSLSKGRVFSIEHPTEGMPALTVFSGNAGQLLRGDAPTIQVLKAIRQRAQRNGVPFIIHLQEAGTGKKQSVGMAKLLEDIFGDEVALFCYGPEESNGLIRPGMDQYTISSKNLPVRARSVMHLPVVERTLLRKNQRVAINTSYDFPLPNGELAYLVSAGFHYDLGLTSTSKHISLLQAADTRVAAELLLQQDIGNARELSDHSNDDPSVRGRKGLLTFSGDGNTRGFVGTRWQLDRTSALRQGLGANVKEATEEIGATAHLTHSIQQEFIERKHPWMQLAGNLVNDALGALDSATGGKWGERKLDHQFYRDFTITSSGELESLERFDVIENNVFYGFENADHYVIGTLFGYRAAAD